MAEGALASLKVVDLTWHVAGPFCTKILADYGADVIKVERPGEGDPARGMGPFFKDDPHPEKSGPFLFLNTSKRSITLNLKSETGRQLLKELLKSADILVENFRPGVMASLGLDYETLEKINPALVMTSISNFGQSGPYRDFKAQDITLQAMSSVMSLYGDAKREPIKQYGDQAQYQAGLFGALGTMTALTYRRLTGEGQHVDVSILEANIHMLEHVLATYEFSGFVRKRILNRRPSAHPFTILPCKDGWACVTSLVPRDWEMIAAFTGMPELAEDERFRIGVARAQYADEVDAALHPWLMEHSKYEILHGAQEWRIPWGPLFTVDELLKSEQLRARGFFVKVDHPVTGEVEYPGALANLTESPFSIRRPAPLLGQHNEEVFCEQLGLSKDDLVKLRERGVI